jgi:hypothetical protein
MDGVKVAAYQAPLLAAGSMGALDLSRARVRACEAEGVARAIFTHCGSLIVKSDTRRIEARISELGRKHGVEASVAYDGLSLSLEKRRSGRAR